MVEEIKQVEEQQVEVPAGSYLTIAEAAAYASVSVRTIKNWLNQGLVHSKVSIKIVRIKKEWLDDFFEKHIQRRHVTKDLVNSIVSQMKGAA